MNVKTERRFDHDYVRLPRHLQQRVKQQLGLLLADPHHPSLETRKMDGQDEIWEARVTGGYRFTFRIEGQTYRLRRVGTHDVLRNP